MNYAEALADAKKRAINQKIGYVVWFDSTKGNFCSCKSSTFTEALIENTSVKVNIPLIASINERGKVTERIFTTEELQKGFAA